MELSALDAHQRPSQGARPQPSLPPRRPGRHAARTRDYSRDRIPGYGRFCEVASRHRGDWWITYDHGSPSPYRAQSRRAEDTVITTSTIDLLDDALTALTALTGVAYARPYRPATPAETEERRLLAATVREVA